MFDFFIRIGERGEAGVFYTSAVRHCSKLSEIPRISNLIQLSQKNPLFTFALVNFALVYTDPNYVQEIKKTTTTTTTTNRTKQKQREELFPKSGAGIAQSVVCWARCPA